MMISFNILLVSKLCEVSGSSPFIFIARRQSLLPSNFGSTGLRREKPVWRKANSLENRRTLQPAVCLAASGVVKLSAAVSTPQICLQSFKMKEDYFSRIFKDTRINKTS